MTELSALWMPILLGAVLVWLASAVIHMVLPLHKNDYGRVPNEDAVMDVLRPFGIPRGDYVMPRVSGSADMKNPATIEKLNKGPVMVITVMPNGVFNMGKTLGLWLLYCVLVDVFVAYLTSRVLGPGAPYLSVFRVAGTATFLAFAGALAQGSIWYHRSWGTTFRSTIDGLIYAGLVGGTFGWLWPK